MNLLSKSNRKNLKSSTLKSVFTICFLVCLIGSSHAFLINTHQNSSSVQDSLKLQSYIQIIREHIAESDSVRKYAKLGLKESVRKEHIDFQGQFLMFLTISSHNKGNYEEALKFGREAISKFDKSKNVLWAAGVSRQVGQVFIDMLFYDSAMHYCIKALDYHSSIEINPGTMEAMSSIAEIHELNNNIDQAISWLKRMLYLAEINDFQHYQSSAHYQLGKVYDQLEDYDSAIHFKKLALQNTSSLKSNNYVDIIGSLSESFYKAGQLDSAKGYASEYYKQSRSQDPLYRGDQKRAASALQLGVILLDEGDLKSAKSKLLESVAISKEISFKKKLSEAYKALYELTRKENLHEEALEYYLNYAELRSEEINEENQKTIQRLNFEFDTKQKAQEISLLKIESDLKDAEINQARNTLYWLVAVVFILVLFGFTWFNRIKLKQRIQLAEAKEESQKRRFRSLIEGEQKERKRIAQELHDGLGQLLATARLSISSQDRKNENLNHTVRVIDTAVDEVRSISHNLMPNALTLVGLAPAIEDLIRTINLSGGIKAVIKMGGIPMLDESMSVAIYRIIQEVINNALKYAEATTLTLEIEANGELGILIKDDGKGFDTSKIENSKGIGWKNIYSRAEMLNGNISVFSKLGEGTTIKINIPLDESSKASIG